MSSFLMRKSGRRAKFFLERIEKSLDSCGRNGIIENSFSGGKIFAAGE